METDALPIELLAYSIDYSIFFCCLSVIIQTVKTALSSNQLLASYLVNSMLTFVLAVFLKLYFRCTFSHTYTRAIVSVAALAAFKPDIFPFTLLFSHKIRSNQTGPVTYELSDYHSDSLFASINLAGFSVFLLN